MDHKKNVASKMQSKQYTTTRCGHCGKFGHHHSQHKMRQTETMKDMGGNNGRLLKEIN